MSYYILKTNAFDKATPGTAERTIYLLKNKDIPAEQQKEVLHLRCSSIKRISGISRLMIYLNMNTKDPMYIIQPYIIKRLSWNEAVDKFGFEYDSDTSETGAKSISDGDTRST
jgi:hypothetical protein